MTDVIVGNSTADIVNRWLGHTLAQPQNPDQDNHFAFASGGVWLINPSDPNLGDVATMTAGGPDWASPGAASISFLDLTDTPAAYAAAGGQILRVTGAEDGVEFLAGVDYSELVGTQPPPVVHAATHALGGSDEVAIDYAQLVGTQPGPALHAATHELLGADVLSIDWTQLVGTQPQPSIHGDSHHAAGGDEVDVEKLLNYDADDNIAHSGVQVVAGNALTGGGTIEATRTLDVDESALNAALAFIPTTDIDVIDVLTQAAYDALTPDARTLYLING